MIDDSIYKIMAFTNLINNINYNIFEWHIVVPFICYFIVNNYFTIKKKINKMCDFYYKNSTLTTGSISFNSKYISKHREKIGAMSITHYIYKNIEQIHGIRHVEEIEENKTNYLYEDENTLSDDEDEITNDIRHLFRISQEDSLIFPNGIKLVTWKEQTDTSSSDKDNTKREEYYMKLSYNKCNSKDENTQFILIFMTEIINSYIQWKKNNKDLNQYVFNYDHSESNKSYYNCLKINLI